MQLRSNKNLGKCKVFYYTIALFSMQLFVISESSVSKLSRTVYGYEFTYFKKLLSQKEGRRHCNEKRSQLFVIKEKKVALAIVSWLNYIYSSKFIKHY